MTNLDLIPLYNWEKDFEDMVESNPDATPEECKNLTYAFIQELLDKQKEELLEKLTLIDSLERSEWGTGYDAAVSDLESLKKAL